MNIEYWTTGNVAGSGTMWTSSTEVNHVISDDRIEELLDRYGAANVVYSADELDTFPIASLSPGTNSNNRSITYESIREAAEELQRTYPPAYIDEVRNGIPNVVIEHDETYWSEPWKVWIEGFQGLGLPKYHDGGEMEEQEDINKKVHDIIKSKLKLS